MRFGVIVTEPGDWKRPREIIARFIPGRNVNPKMAGRDQVDMKVQQLRFSEETPARASRGLDRIRRGRYTKMQLVLMENRQRWRFGTIGDVGASQIPSTRSRKVISVGASRLVGRRIVGWIRVAGLFGVGHKAQTALGARRRRVRRR